MNQPCARVLGRLSNILSAFPLNCLGVPYKSPTKETAALASRNAAFSVSGFVMSAGTGGSKVDSFKSAFKEAWTFSGCREDI
jgi:hypothetical protein